MLDPYNSQYPYGYLNFAKAPISSSAGSELDKSKLLYNNQNKTFTLGKYTHDYKVITTVIKEELVQIDTIIEECLPLLNRSWLTVRWMLDRGVEDLVNNTSPGYSFMSDPRVVSKATNDIGVDSILKEALKIVIERDPLGIQGTLNNIYVSELLSKLEHITTKIMGICFVTSGLPPRNNELVRLRAVNGEEGIRNIFLRGEYVMIVCEIFKTETIKGFRTAIPRFLIPDISNLLLFYIAVLRPLMM